MDDLFEAALDEAVTAGASYADVRAVTEETRSTSVQDDRVDGLGRTTSRGIGVRVLVEGAWGFAGTSTLERDAVLGAARTAVAVARASASARREPIRLAPSEAPVGTWETPLELDPFAVGVEEQLELLFAVTRAAREVDGLAFAKASTDAWRTTKRFLSSEGADVRQRLVHVAAGGECIAVGDHGYQVRSFPNSFRGSCVSGGWEHVVGLDLAAVR